MNTDYHYWTNALRGTFLDVAIDDPQCGFYEQSSPKKQHREACAIWRDENGTVLALVGKRSIDPVFLWPSVSHKPITEEIYRRVERGEGWPDAIETIIGHNNPPTDEANSDEVESAVKAATVAAALGIKNQLEADRLGNIRDRLAKLFQAKEKERKAEKEPHLEAGRAVDAKFNPILAEIEAAGKIVKAELTKWLRAEDDRIAKELAEKAKADRAAREAAEAKNAPPPIAIETVEPERPRAGTVGRATGLREFKSAVIVDYAKALQALASNAEIQALVQSLADRAARAGIALDGCELKIEKRAA